MTLHYFACHLVFNLAFTLHYQFDYYMLAVELTFEIFYQWVSQDFALVCSPLGSQSGALASRLPKRAVSTLAHFAVPVYQLPSIVRSLTNWTILHTYIYVYTYLYILIYVFIFISIYHKNMYTSYIYIHIYIHMYIYTYTHLYIYI